MRDVAWSPDGTRLVGLDPRDDQSLRVWPAPGGGEAGAIRGHTFAVTAAAWSPDGARLVSASSDGTLKVWDGRAGPETPALPGNRVAWSRGGPAAARLRGHRRYIDDPGPRAGRGAIVPARCEGPVHGLAWDPDGVRLASAGQDRVIRIWDVPRGAEIGRLTGHGASVVDVADRAQDQAAARPRQGRGPGRTDLGSWQTAVARCKVCDERPALMDPFGRLEAQLARRQVAGRCLHQGCDGEGVPQDAATGRRRTAHPRAHGLRPRAIGVGQPGRPMAGLVRRRPDHPAHRRGDGPGEPHASRPYRGHLGRGMQSRRRGSPRPAPTRTARVAGTSPPAEETLGLGGHAAARPDRGGLGHGRHGPGHPAEEDQDDPNPRCHRRLSLAARAPACLSRLDRRLAAEAGRPGEPEAAGRGPPRHLEDWDAAAADATSQVP